MSLRVLLSVLVLAAGAAHAADYPAGNVKVLVPYAAGGSTDQKARIVAEGLRAAFDKPFVVDNRPGAATALAARLLARAAPDGLTLMVTTGSTTALAPLLSSNAGFTPDQLVAVAIINRSPWILDVPANSPFNSVQELATYAKANPGKLNLGTQGNGGNSHLIGELLRADAGIDIFPIHYNGSSPALQAMMAGEIQLYFDSVTTSLPMGRQKQLKMLGITSEKRLGIAPEIPTLVEQGYPNVVFYSWNGVFVPAGTPRDLIERLNLEIRKALAVQAVRDRLHSEGSEIPDMDPAQFEAFVAADRAAMAKIVAPLNLKLD